MVVEKYTDRKGMRKRIFMLGIDLRILPPKYKTKSKNLSTPFHPSASVPSLFQNFWPSILFPQMTRASVIWQPQKKQIKRGKMILSGCV